MNRIHALAGAILGVCVLTLGVAQAAPDRVARQHGPAAAGVPEPSSNLEPSTATPPARAGTDLAARRLLSERQLRKKLRARMGAVGGSSGAWVYDLDAPHDPVLFTDHGSKRRILASNSKLFTTTALLGRFGPKATFKTRLWTRGELSGPRNRRVLHGSLGLVGAGDPALSSGSFARNNNLPLTRIGVIARKVAASGITKVTGGLVADESIFDGRRSVPQPGVSGGPYLSTLSGLSWDSGFDNSGYARKPAKRAGQALVESLSKRGIRVKGAVRIGRVPASTTRKPSLAAVKSPTVAELLAATNKPSNNFYAEMLLKRLAAGNKSEGTTKRGARRAERYAKRLGSGVTMINGSGLTRENRASPQEVGRLLVGIQRKGVLRHALPASLSIAGVDGTLAARMRGTAAQGRCRGKTGTIDGVSALSGYCERAGHTVAFSILMNGVDITTAQNAQDGMVAAIARYGH
jgi:D-alanyl-D-alanine carboxypeptidase/D-alanyl-D-alanine-endopeptidase (penicillin-binding protein 4)